MDFKTKIARILDSNSIGIDSINALEKRAGIGNSCLARAVRKNREPSIKVMKKLFDFLINKDWWQSGVGPIFKGDIEITTNEEESLLVKSLLEQIKLQRELIALLKEKIPLGKKTKHTETII